jgi:hypothetical protein
VDGGAVKLSPKVQKLLAAQRKFAKFPYLIKISHETGHGFPMYFANAPEDITYAENIYNAASFSIEPPDRDGSNIGDATLTLSAIDQFWIQKIRENQKPARIQFMAVIAYNDDNTGIEGIEPMEDISFILRAASFNEMAITWTMVFDENMAINIPADTCNAMATPGCS